LVYDSPPELGGLWTDVSEMMKEMGGQQKTLLTIKIRKDAAAAARRKARIKHYMEEITYAGLAVFLIFVLSLIMVYVSYDRKQRWPELEPAIITAKQEERRKLKLLELQQYQEKVQRDDEEYNQKEKN